MAFADAAWLITVTRKAFEENTEQNKRQKATQQPVQKHFKKIITADAANSKPTPCSV